MLPVNFPGAIEIKKPVGMTDEQCSSIWAEVGMDSEGFPYFCTAWKPNKEDLDALNNGGTVYVKSITNSLPPMVLFTIDQKTQTINV